MWTSSLYNLLLPSLAACDIFHIAPPPADVLIAVTVNPPSTTAALVPTLSTPTTTSTPIVDQENLELKHRQAPDAAPIGNTVPDRAMSTAAIVSSVPTRPIFLTHVAPAHTASHVITVIWVETWIDSTSQTWFPTTLTIRFDVAQTKAPEPGVGIIGMGTLTGQARRTKTAVVGAAATRGVKWRKGAVVAAGVGLLGVLGL